MAGSNVVLINGRTSYAGDGAIIFGPTDAGTCGNSCNYSISILSGNNSASSCNWDYGINIRAADTSSYGYAAMYAINFSTRANSTRLSNYAIVISARGIGTIFSNGAIALSGNSVPTGSNTITFGWDGGNGTIAENSVNSPASYGIVFSPGNNASGNGNLGALAVYSVFIGRDVANGGLGSSYSSASPYSIGIGYRAAIATSQTANTGYGTGMGCISLGYASLGTSSNAIHAIGINFFPLYARGAGASAYSIAIGYQAGGLNSCNAPPTGQTSNYITIGYQAGSIFPGSNAIYIGYNAGYYPPTFSRTSFTGLNSIGIGYYAGYSNQGSSTIAIGYNAGYYGQSTNSIAIGYQAGYSNQSTNAIAIGYRAGFSTQMDSAIAIGSLAGFANQSTNSIAIGYKAGSTLQGTNSIAIGPGAGQNIQASYAIAFGALAGVSSQSANSIILNASPYKTDTTTPGFFVSTVRNLTGTNGLNILSYDTTANELFYSDTLIISSLYTKFGVASNGIFIPSDSNAKQDISLADLALCYSNVKQLPLRRFTYIPSYATSKIDQTQIGFIAQEVYSKFPKSIFSTFDESMNSSIMNLNFDQIFLSHYGATQLLVSSVEGYQSCISSLQIIKVSKQSTLEGLNNMLLSMENSYQTLITKISTFI
jgi:hypothetical protein